MTTSLPEIEQAIVDVARTLGAERAILFGSGARGTATRRSDVDVVFLVATTKRFLDRTEEPYRLLAKRIRGRGIDVLVYTPHEFERMRSKGNKFIQRVLEEGKVLYGT